jgi:hypothetical protein
MNDPTSASVAHETGLPANAAFEDPAQIKDSDERIRSSVTQLASGSVDKLDGLITELQEMREVLKSEGERVQREVGNYAQLTQTVSAATKTMTEAVASWISTDVAGLVQVSTTRQLSGGREKLRRWPAAAG